MNGLCLAVLLDATSSPIDWTELWPYFSGTVVMIVGLAALFQGLSRTARGIDRALLFGPVFFAAPMAVFGTEHYVFTKSISAMVPSWIPGHLFWTYLTGSCLIAAALSIVSKRYSALAATLLGVMLFSFVLTISLPAVMAHPDNRFLVAVFLRDLSFSMGAFALAVTDAGLPPEERTPRRIARVVMGGALVFFGAEYFLHPLFVPVIPLQKPLPDWFPGALALPLAYGMGSLLIASGLGLILDWRARSIAAWLGVAIVAIVLLVYLPILVTEPSVGVGLNYFADTLAYGGAILVLARALPRDEAASPAH